MHPTTQLNSFLMMLFHYLFTHYIMILSSLSGTGWYFDNSCFTITTFISFPTSSVALSFYDGHTILLMWDQDLQTYTQKCQKIIQIKLILWARRMKRSFIDDDDVIRHMTRNLLLGIREKSFNDFVSQHGAIIVGIVVLWIKSWWKEKLMQNLFTVFIKWEGLIKLLGRN